MLQCISYVYVWCLSHKYQLCGAHDTLFVVCLASIHLSLSESIACGHSPFLQLLYFGVWHMLS